MAMVCTEVTEWIRQEISKPVEDWEESTEKKCKKRKWYDPRGWFCWFVRVLVLVVRWIVVTVLTAVTTIVCHLAVDLLSIHWNALKFLANLFKALITWHKCVLQVAIGNLADALAVALELAGNVLIRPVTDRIQTYRLRNHVSQEIDERFADRPELAETIKKNFNINTGVFGYRLTVTLYHMFVDSETRTPQSGDVPNLFFLHDTKQINLYELAGFDDDCAIFEKTGWHRSHPRTAKKTSTGAGGGAIETDLPELTRDELNEYINSRGAKGPPFLIFAMSTSRQNARVKAAQLKGRQLGLLLTFDSKFKEVTDPQFLNYRESAINVLPIDCMTKAKAQADYLICELARKPDKDFVCCDVALQQTNVPAAPTQAFHDLCQPVAVAIFRYTNKQRSGFASNLIGTVGYDHDLSDSPTSGVSFRAQIPDEVRKWVLIHELGHYFGLTHVDGFDRIMVSGKEGQGSVWTWKAISNSLWHGGPRFTFTEAKRVWNFILTNFPTECLAPSSSPPPVIL